MLSMRVGIGYDIHRLVKGRPLRLGGVTIPHPKGLAGHSDGDVLTHAVVDAMLGAAGLGDIGEHFPDTDRRWKGADSRVFLRAAAALLKKRKWSVENVDSVIIAEKPDLSRFKKGMRAYLARELGVPVARVSVKAKTNEGLGPLGRGEAVACQAVVSLRGK
jgi:2-C-methyl-D-erythritol 2,4-cyclodiphosphate synthase